MDTQRKGYYTVGEVAKEVGVHPQTVRRWLRDGQIEGTLADLPSERTAEDAGSAGGPASNDELAARRAARKIG